MAGRYTPQLGRQFAIQAAMRNNVDPRLLTAVLQQESGFRADAVSPVGARGPGQFMPATWSDPGFGLSFKGDINDPYANIEASAQYLGAMQNRYGGNTNKALAAYNWGAGNADKWDGSPASLPAETRNYIASISGNYGAGDQGDIISMAMRNGPVTIADEAQSPANSTFAPSIMEEREQKPQFHAGNALQSLGAAISATAMGESAAPQLGEIRDQYFAEQEAEYQKQLAEKQRLAMISMVGADSEFGQALANGADPQMVMQAYMQSQGFGHDFAMADRGFAYDQSLAQQGFGFDTQLNDQRFGQERVLQQDQYGYQRAGARDDAYLQDERDATLHQYDLDEQSAGSRLRREELRYGRELEEEAAVNETERLIQSQERLRSGYAQVAGNMHGPEAAAQVNSLPPEVFADPETARKFMETFIGPEAAAEGFTLSQGQVRFDAAGNPIAFGLPETTERYRPLTPQEIRDRGLEAGKGYQINEATGQVHAIGGGGTTVNVVDGAGVPGLGKVGNDQGFVTDENGDFVLDPETNLPRVAPLPGSELAREQAATDAERAANAQKALNAQRAKLQKSGTILSYLDVAREQNMPAATGFFGQLTGGIGGTPANRLKHTLVPLTSNIGFEELANMRQNSPTGGALGSVAVEELRQLQGVLGSLDPEQGVEGLNRSLDKIEQHYFAAVRDVMKDPNLSEADRQYALTMLGVSDDEQAELASEDDDALINRYLD